MLWQEQSWPQIHAIDKKTPVVIPLGSCQQHGMTTSSISHACEYETSMILVLRPELVRMDQVVEGPSLAPWNKTELGKKGWFFRRFHRLTAAGNLGKPSAATPDKGRSLID